MKKKRYFISITTALLIVLTITAAFSKRKPMSVFMEDTTKGFNGSFEHTKDGLPFNWQLYTARTVPSGDFDILPDNTDFKEGKQSLKFVIRECASTGGWHSPGLAKQIKAKPGKTYRISFWVKNKGNIFAAKVGGVSAMKGTYEDMVKSNEQITDWRLYEYSYTVPERMTGIRFELNVLQRGTFWIDDVTIEPN